MVSDIFHVLPTDGKVNGYRSNWPYGECNSGTTYGLGKLGSCTYSGYTGTVFEPADEYKGDIARIYFYMATRYMDVISGWDGESFNGNNLSNWTRTMMLQWHHDDPVSQKEIDRNNAAYDYQHNRNPYVDNPEWADAVWDPNYIPNSVSTNKVFFDVYPNPASDYIIVNCTLGHDQNSKIDIIDLTGRIVYSQKTNDVTENINISNLPEGVYFVSVSIQGRKLIQRISVVR
jgi:hypothetical protein